MITTIITDIEGTTTSLSFVKDVLFPYARAHIADYVQQHTHEDEVKKQIDATRALMSGHPSLDEVIARLISWIDQDQKITPLKALQGMIWEAGYRNGDFTGHVYEDAHRHIKVWHQEGHKIYIYSSGSVFAQKLIYGFSDFGDMTPYLSGYFDTNVGQKRDAASYRNILKAIDTPAENVLFLSDIVEELDAAAAEGIHTYWLIRDGEIPNNPRHRVARSFNDITLT